MIFERALFLKSNGGIMKYFYNISWLFLQNLLRMIVGLFVGVWLARYLGPEQFGLFSYVLSFVGLFSIVATLGLDGIVVRELVKYKEKKRKILMTSFMLKLIGAGIVMLLLFVAVDFTDNDRYTNELVFIIAASTVFQSFNVIDFYFQSVVLSRYVVFANLISLFLSSLIKISLILLEAPLEAFVYAAVFDSFVVACGLIYFIFVKCRNTINVNLLFFCKVIFYWDKNIAKQLLRDSWPLILVGAASAMNMRLDQVFLGNMLGNEVVGNYAAAVRIAEVWLVLPVIIGNSLYPWLIEAKASGEIIYKNRVRLTIKYMALLAIPIALLICFMAENIVIFLYGDSYSKSGIYLALYIWTGLPYLIFFALGKMMLIENITKISFYVTLVSVTLNLVLNILLIPKYGGEGAIFATLITTYISTFISILIVNYKTGVFWKLRRS